MRDIGYLRAGATRVRMCSGGSPREATASERQRHSAHASQTDEIRAALGKRVEVGGRLARDIEDRPVSVKMRSLEVLHEAPVTDLIGLDRDFTGGVDPMDYLREIRGAS
ncbi:hypothetical protein [Micromonospora sp. U56]|uniref:hypothetical protein n=1 Tax=Micromonospora sp. U56 TaxID=2824900 RepID=UPI001FFDCDB3|nr:hypothetical protein [Micromonospora sp. U56]